MRPMSVLEALGEGVVSVPETLWDGIKRTGQGLEFWNGQEQDKIGAQDIRAYEALKEIYNYGISNYNSPVEKAVRIILYHFYESLPRAEKEKVVDAAKHKGILVTSKTVTSVALSEFVANRLSKKIIDSTIMKMLIKQLVKLEFNIVAMQGLLYKAGAASDRLKSKFPRIYSPRS